MDDLNMFDLVGKRLQINAQGSRTNLGLGTYLWGDEILLDSGKKILGKYCTYRVVPQSEVPAFDIVLLEDTRIFEDGGISLVFREYWLHGGEQIHVEKIEMKPWNHGGYVAGRFVYQLSEYWLIMSEVKLPMERPYLRAVS